MNASTSSKTGLDAPASARFIVATLGIAWILSFVLANVTFRDFITVCNTDPGAVLQVDQAVLDGKHAGVDFYYCYGLLPIIFGRLAWAILGRTPTALLAVHALFTSCLAWASGSIFAKMAPTRCGALIAGLAILQAVPASITTHSMEAALLAGSLLAWVSGKTRTALSFAALGMFAKVSMPTVVLTGMVGLLILRALREKRSSPLRDLLVVPVVLVVTGAVLGITYGFDSLVATENPLVGRNNYAANHMGFFHEGRDLWDPRLHPGHAINWYLGSGAGAWLLGTIALFAIAVPAAWRLIRGAIDREVTVESKATMTDELVVLCAGGHLGFILVFFAPTPHISHYAYMLVIGLSPLLARASITVRHARVAPLVFAASALTLLIAASAPIRRARQRFVGDFVAIGGLYAPKDVADDWTAARATAAAMGTVAHVGAVSNFAMIDPAVREVHYWFMMLGMPKNPSVAEMHRLADEADAVIFSKLDLATAGDIPELHDVFARPRIHDGPYFVVVRGATASASVPRSTP
jgi:hypothetical protein